MSRTPGKERAGRKAAAIAPEDEVDPFLLAEVDPKEIRAFYAAIGEAMSAWQQVESALYHVYEAAILPEIPGAAAAAFHSPQSLNAKLQMTDVAVRFVGLKDNSILPEWERLYNHVDKKSKRRNAFAHFQIEVNCLASAKTDRILLRPLLFDTRYTSGIKNKERYSTSDISNIVNRFVEIAKDIRKFSRDILLITRKWRE